MPLSEFELIRRYFQEFELNRSDVVLGIGDDCALLQPPVGQQLAISADTVVSGVHFYPDVDPVTLGHKALAVNLSDLAAMGATPAWVTMAITLPAVDESWLEGFSRGFATLAKSHCIQLVGGDTTRGPLSVTIQVMGFVDPVRSLRRDAAITEDHIYVTGTLGDAATALQCIQEDITDTPPSLLDQLQMPEPRTRFGCAVTEYAKCAIDISDGLLADLGHIVSASGVGAEIELSALPLSDDYRALSTDKNPWQLALSGGDDYELCITVPPANCERVENLALQQGLELTRIGSIVSGVGVRCLDDNGQEIDRPTGGFDHFKSADKK